MAQQPSVIVFDVNETLSDMAPIADRFAEIGAPPGLATTWFASLLRDGFALAAAGGQAPFATVGAGVLRTLLASAELDREVGAAVEHVMGGFGSLSLHPDVPDGVHALRAAGLRLVTLTNGSADISRRLLGSSGLVEEFEQLLSVEDAGVWKPARGAYEHAARSCGTDLADMTLVASHPWDIDGAARAGMGTAWINRTGAPYPDYFTPPRSTISALSELVDALPSSGGTGGEGRGCGRG